VITKRRVKILEKALLENEEDYRAQLGMALYEQNVGENKAAHQRYQKILTLAPLKCYGDESLRYFFM